MLQKYFTDTVPFEYHDRLTPRYRKSIWFSRRIKHVESGLLAFGCKRFVIDSGYFDSLNRRNTDFNCDGIAKITERGVITERGGHLKFDVIIQATGFVAVCSKSSDL